MKNKITNLTKAALNTAAKTKATVSNIKAKVTRAKATGPATKVTETKVTDIVPKVTTPKVTNTKGNNKLLKFINTLSIFTTTAQPYIFIYIYS